jgi:hypothetical protein
VKTWIERLSKTKPKSKPKPTARRSAPRISAEGKLDVRVVDIDMPVSIRDISFGGVAIKSPGPFRKGDRHTLQFTTKTGAVIQVPATVAHCRRVDDGEHISGWQFILEPSHAQAILQLLDAVSGILSSRSLRLVAR